MPTVRNSIFNSFLEKYSIAALHFVNIFILARLLTPSDIGIYTLGVALVAFAHVFRDFGVSTYIIQEKNLTVSRVAADPRIGCQPGGRRLLPHHPGTIPLSRRSNSPVEWIPPGHNLVHRIFSHIYFLRNLFLQKCPESNIKNQ